MILLDDYMITGDTEVLQTYGQTPSLDVCMYIDGTTRPANHRAGAAVLP
jgi:hypothetical protein